MYPRHTLQRNIEIERLVSKLFVENEDLQRYISKLTFIIIFLLSFIVFSMLILSSGE